MLQLERRGALSIGGETDLDDAGLAAVRDTEATGLVAFEDVPLNEEILAFDVHRMFAEGDTVIVLGHFAGRAKPDGREWSTDFVHHLTITDGLLHRWEAFYDTAAALGARA